MKKTILFGAKTLAAVALTSLIFTNCDEENFTVNPAKLPNASATISATTMDLNNGRELEATYSETMPYSVPVGTDGTIAAQKKPITSTVKGYLTRTKDINIPAVAKGQSIYIPVVFYTTNMEDIMEDIITLGEPVFEDVSIYEAEDVKITEFEAGTTDVITFPIPEGMKLADNDEFKEFIAELSLEDARSASDAQTLADIKEALNAFADAFEDFDTNFLQVELHIPNGTASIKVEYDVIVNKGELELTAEYNGYVFDIPTEIEEVAGIAYTITFLDEDGHAHSSHSGGSHGDSNNDGGGSAGE